MAEKPRQSFTADDPAVRAVVRRAAERKFPLFCFAPDVEKADLIQVGLLAVTRAAANFDPSKGAWTTFCYTVAARRMLNLWGQRSRQFARD